jgi:hypothetical protein
MCKYAHENKHISFLSLIKGIHKNASANIRLLPVKYYIFSPSQYQEVEKDGHFNIVLDTC